MSSSTDGRQGMFNVGSGNDLQGNICPFSVGYGQKLVLPVGVRAVVDQVRCAQSLCHLQLGV